MLQHKLSQDRPDVVPGLHQLAATWFEANDEPIEGIRHAIRARDWDELTRMLTASFHLVLSSDGPDLVVALDPVAALANRADHQDGADANPPLYALLAAALCHYSRCDFHAARQDMRRAAEFLPAASAAVRRAVSGLHPRGAGRDRRGRRIGPSARREHHHLALPATLLSRAAGERRSAMGDIIAFPVRERAERSSLRASMRQHDARPSSAQPWSAPPLWREVIGTVLRDERHRQHRTLAQVAERAGMSVQYLSEIERGRKEPSSEMLAAACGSLGLSLGQFAFRCAGAIERASTGPTGPVLLAA